MSESDERPNPDDGGGAADGSSPGRQFVAELVRELEGVSPDLLRGRSRFPAKYELSHAPAQFRSIVAIAQRMLNRWQEVPPNLAEQVERNLMRLIEIVAAIEAREQTVEADMLPDARRISGELRVGLGEIQEFFSEVVEPLIDESEEPGDPRSAAARLSPKELDNIRRTRDELNRSKQEIADLEARYAQIDAELEGQKDLIEAAREATGMTGAKDLARAYEEQAEAQERQWKYWGAALLGATLTALVVGYVVLLMNRPSDDATTAQLVSHVAIDLLIIGMLIYAVRITSLQFSVHRHLDAVARNKAAALVTFSRIVSSGSSSETRDRLAEVLAHYVFISNDTGFLDSTGEQITLPERLANPVAQRINGARTAGPSQPS